MDRSDDLVTKAEREIAAILAQLQTDTGAIVDTIGFRDVDVTNIDDDRTQWQRHVVIEMKRLPGTNWGQ